MKRALLCVIVTLAIATLACSTGAFLAPTTPEPVAPRSTATSVVVPTALPPAAGGVLSADEALLENIYARVNPAVVNITVVSGADTQQTEAGTGSGFEMDKQGH